MSKFSAFPVAASFAAADVLAGLVGGADKQIPRAVFFTAPPATALQIVQGTSAVGLDAAGNVVINVPILKTTTISLAGVPIITISSAGFVTIQAFPGSGVNVQAGGAVFSVTIAGAINVAPAGGQVVTIGYTPAFPGDWVVPPTDLLVAVDRIARVVSAFGATPIP